jgi:RHS repeat-associated protein
MFYSSINPQDLSIFSTGISTPYSDGAYGLFTEFLNPLTNIQNTSAIFSIESELVNGITNYSLPEKIISADYLIREKFSNFIITGNELKIKDSPNFEDKPNYRIRVRTTDVKGLSYEQSLIVDIINVNETLTDIALDNDIVEENISGAAIATISITDPDTVATFRNNTVTVNDSRFEVINNNGIIQLKLKGGQSLDYETEPTIAIALTATDNSNSSLTYSENFTINVTNVNETPTNIALNNNSVTENSGGAVIGNITVTDPDQVATFRNNTVTVNDSRFEVINNNGIIQLKLKGGQGLDYETEPTIAIALTATDNSNSSLTYSENFTINVIDVDENIETPTISAALTNDTGVSNSDRLTLDPTVNGQTQGATSLQGNLNGNGFVDISSALNEDGSFTISFEQYDVLSNDTLPNGIYLLELKAKNSSGQESEIVTVSFTLDWIAPPLSFELASESDTGEKGDNVTTAYKVNLIGQTDPGLEVMLVETQQKAVADETGAFRFNDVTLPSAGKAPYSLMVSDAAGNQGQTRQFLTREGINGAPEITSTPGTVFDTTQQTTYTYQIAATDPDNDALTYTLINALQEVEIYEDGLLSFTPSGVLKPFYDFNLEVSDGRGGKDTQTFTVDVMNENLGTIRGTKWEDLNKNGLRDLARFSNFDDISRLSLKGDTTIVDSDLSGETALRLTRNRGFRVNTSGNALLQNPFDLVDEDGNILSFSTKFEFAITSSMGISDEDGVGADGIAFIISPTDTLGSAGGGLGYGGLLNSIAIELDTFNNNPFGISDVSGNHIGIDLNGNLNSIAQTNIDGRFNDGEIWTVWIDYDGKSQTLEARVAQGDTRPQEVSVSTIVNIPEVLDQENFFVGFGSGIAAGWGNHDILSWEFGLNEPGLAGVSVYLDSNNNGKLDPDEPVKLTAEDDLSTLDIDETGKYEFNNLLSGNYTVREIIPPDFKQTFPTGSISGPDFYTVELDVGGIVENINFGNVRSTSENRSPLIISEPVTLTVPDVPYRYQIRATDANGDTLTYTLKNPPDGMAIDENGLITWNPNAIGNNAVAIEVSDGKGGVATQNYSLNVIEVTVDTEVPQVYLGFSSNVFERGETINLQIQGFDNVGLADLDLSFDGNSLTLDPDYAIVGGISTASVQLTQPGIFTVVATATDLAGNKDTETLSVRVLDPNDTSAPIAKLDLSGFDPLNLVIRQKTEVKGKINDQNLEFYRVELAPVSLIDLSNPAAKDPDYITIAEGTGNIDGILASIDPALYRNDNYFVRIYAQDINGNITVEGFGVGIDSQTKPGEFSLDYTDLSIPLTGIPIEVTRRYSSLDANFQGDFGYGWELGLQDAQIVESAPTGVDLNFDDFFGGNSFTEGTRVTLTTPDGRRVGFTFTPEVFSASAGIFLGPDYYAWQPKFTPDPGVYETLEVPYVPIMRLKDGSFGIYLFGLTYNPSDYILTTKDGTKYTYDQYEGLETIVDRNANKLTYTDNGITSSTGAKIDFIRDTQGRITEIIDPDGKSLKYSYDTNGNLIEFGDRTNNETTFEYQAQRDHYLTKVIDPLNRTSVRTEYDENGQISKIIDANGNELEINLDAAASSQTIKDPFGNNITRIFDNQGNVIQEVDQLGGITLRTYNANNNLLSETDPEGNTTSYTYDNRGNKLTETDGEGKTKTYTYNAKNDILTETDALGNRTTYTYDVSGNLTQREDAEGNVTTYNYGANGLLTTVIDANNKTSTFSYDNFGNLTELIDPTGAKTTFTYDNNGRVKSVTDALGAITNYIYDDQGRLIEKADPEGSSCGCARGITKTEYNAAGEKIAETDALGRRTEYRYNERGLLIETILPDSTPDILTDNPHTKNEYDALDRLTIFTDELGRKTYYVYDKLGRQIEVIYPDSTPNDLNDNPRTKKEYDKAGLVIAEIDELGNRTELKYDNAERLISRTNALNEVTTYTYDADGRQISMTDALGRKTIYGYDDLDRLNSTNYANNTAMTTSYDGLGRVIAETDLAGNTTNYEYDALGRLTTVIDALNQRTEYKYDAVGNLIEQKDANGNITKFEYDSLRRLQATTLPEGQENKTIHDKIGNLIEVTDFNGVVTTYKYNERNWLIEKSFSDGTPTETFTYTLTGELATVTDNRGVTSYVYDKRDRLISRTEPDGRKIEYIYDNAGNILTLNVPSSTTTYIYDKINRIDTVKDADNGVTDYDYDAVGNLIKTKFGNGVIENQQYDLLNRLTYLENRNQTNVISSYTYTLDGMGNRLKVEENDGRIVEYSYDDLYRLTQEKTTDSVVGNKTIQYQFDAVGNRLQKIDSVEGTTTYSYDDNDRLLQETLGGKVTNYQYDNEGNLKAKIENGITQAEYEWNAKGELTAVEVTENGETGRIEFEYDHNGIRVAINVDGEETRFLIDNNQQQYAQVIEEYQVNGDVKTTYTHGWDLISQDNGNNRIYYQVDGLGSTRQLTDINGAVVVEYDYDAYGNLTRKVGDADNNYLFAGEQFDDAVDGYYLRARYYDSATGRFISSDPFMGYNNQPVTLHDYLYGNANPVIFVDPSGESTIIEYNLDITRINAIYTRRVSQIAQIRALQTALTSCISDILAREYLTEEYETVKFSLSVICFYRLIQFYLVGVNLL